MAQAAKRLTTSTSRRNASAKPQPVPVSRPETYPDQYAKRVQGHCMEPAIADGSFVLVDRSATYAAGDLVVIYLRPEAVAVGTHGVLLKRVVMPMFGRVTLPYRASPLSNVMPLMLVEQDNPPRQYALPADQLLAVHRCLGPVPPDMEMTEDAREGLSAGGDALSRRTVLSGAAAVGAIVATGSAKAMAVSLADMDLLNAGREHARIAALIDHETDVGSAANDAYDALRSGPPDALRWRESDAALGLSKPGWWRVPGVEFVENKDGLYSASSLWDLRHLRERRAMIPGYPENHPKFGQAIPDGEPVGEFMVGHALLVRTAPAAPEVVARVDEIIAALDANHADYKRVMIESGVAAHEERLGQLHDLLEPSTRVLVETPATTIGGIMTKVAAAMWHDHEGDPSEPLSYDLDEMSLGAQSMLAWSVIRDLAALKGELA